jgi:hypothetical protein
MTYPGLAEFADLEVLSNSVRLKTEIGLLLLVAEKGGAPGPTPPAQLDGFS